MTAMTRVLFAAAVIAIGFGVRDVASQGQSVTITLPAAVTFAVTNVGATTIGNPAATRVSFNGAVINANRAVRIGVRADADLTPPSAGATIITANRVSWTTAGAVNGVGFNGTLSRAAYTNLFDGNENATSGQVDVTWRLAALTLPVRAGAHMLAMRWRIQSINP